MLQAMKRVVPPVLLVGVLGSVLAGNAATPAQLTVSGLAGDGAGCAVAADGSFALPHAVSCPGLRVAFPDMGTAFTTARALRSSAPASPRFTALIPALMPGEFVAVILEWTGTDSRIDLCVPATAHSAAVCSGASAEGEVTRVLIIGNPSTASGNTVPQSVALEARVVGGSAPSQVSLALEDHGVHASVRAASDDSARPHDDQNPPAVDVNLDLNPTTINVGQSATLTWTSTNATSCAESGAWSNANAPLSGMQVVTPPSASSYNYTMTCINADSKSMETQTLTVLTPSSGGGGAIDPAALALLAALAGFTLLARREAATPPAFKRVNRLRRSPYAS
jgi:hypothetical protein